jgi:hypothetical protein
MSELIERANAQILAIKKRYGIGEKLRHSDVSIIRRLEAFIRRQLRHKSEMASIINVTETNKR